MSPIIGKSYIFKITSTGEVKEISGVDEMINSALTNAGISENKKIDST